MCITMRCSYWLQFLGSIFASFCNEEKRVAASFTSLSIIFTACLSVQTVQLLKNSISIRLSARLVSCLLATF